MKVLIESIVAFQSVEDFEIESDLIYENLSDDQLVEYLQQWEFPGEADQNWYAVDDVNTNFLGYEYKKDNETYLLNRYENSLVIGLARIVGYDKGEQ